MNKGGEHPGDQKGYNETDWEIHVTTIKHELLHVDLPVNDFWQNDDQEVNTDTDKNKRQRLAVCNETRVHQHNTYEKAENPPG